MAQQPTNTLSEDQKREIDKTVESVLRSPRLRKQFIERVDPSSLLDYLRENIPKRTVESIQSKQDRQGKTAAAAEFLQDVPRYNCWAVPVLDALYENQMQSLALQLYPGYVPPAPDDDTPTDPPPPYRR